MAAEPNEMVLVLHLAKEEDGLEMLPDSLRAWLHQLLVQLCMDSTLTLRLAKSNY
ncbi:hypothetical protein D3C85_1921820 [compost metagenome]